jgi:hypothetical protein
LPSCGAPRVQSSSPVARNHEETIILIREYQYYGFFIAKIGAKKEWSFSLHSYVFILLSLFS